MMQKVSKIEIEKLENGWLLEIKYKGIYDNKSFVFNNVTDLITKLLNIIK